MCVLKIFYFYFLKKFPGKLARFPGSYDINILKMIQFEIRASGLYTGIIKCHICFNVVCTVHHFSMCR